MKPVTPIGAFLGGLKDLSSVDLGVAATKAVLADLPRVEQEHIADVLVGNVLHAGSGTNVARHYALRRRRKRCGVAILCVGDGMEIALALQSCEEESNGL